MKELEFKGKSGMLIIDNTGRFQMGNGPQYASIRLKWFEIDQIIKFLQEAKENYYKEG